MQTTDISADLSIAVNAIEEMLNSSDGASFLEALRKYKQTGEIDNSHLLNLRKYLR